MTPKKEKILWLVYGLALILLFLISSTDMIIKEKKTQVYPVSVIVDDTTDDFYVNFKKGIDQAAIDYHADVSFVTLYERNQGDQQMDMMIRELNDGARAIIVSPVDDASITRALDENTISGPLVIVDSALSHSKISFNISEDYYEAGRTLAEHVAEDTPVSTPIYLLTEGLKGSSDIMAHDGIRSVLEEKGYQVELFEAKTEGAYREFIQSMVYPDKKQAVLIAIDMESLTRVAAILDESSVYQNHAVGFYGFGSTLQILNYLDEGIIDGIVVANDFIQGYLSIQKAVEAIQNSGIHDNIRTEHFYIEKEDIRKKEYQKLLYPID